MKKEDEDQDNTAFTTHRGLYCFVTIPFDLKNIPRSFHRTTDVIFACVNSRFALDSLDDVVILSKAPENLFNTKRLTNFKIFILALELFVCKKLLLLVLQKSFAIQFKSFSCILLLISMLFRLTNLSQCWHYCNVHWSQLNWKNDFCHGLDRLRWTRISAETSKDRHSYCWCNPKF